MTHPTGTVTLDSDGHQRLWIRCPACGDSQKRSWIAHAFIDQSSGRLHCYRCGVWQDVEGWFPTFPLRSSQQPGADRPKVFPGALTTRPSAMARFHTSEAEVFFSSSGGCLMIRGDGTRTASGPLRQGLGLGRWITQPMRTSVNHPLVVVEGPWDVLDGFSDVCLFGAVPSKAQRQLLRGQFVILRPDPDVLNFENLALYGEFVSTWTHSLSIIVGVDIIPRDPDELTATDEIQRVPFSLIERKLHDYLDRFSLRSQPVFLSGRVR